MTAVVYRDVYPTAPSHARSHIVTDRRGHQTPVPAMVLKSSSFDLSVGRKGCPSLWRTSCRDRSLSFPHWCFCPADYIYDGERYGV
jgi:hypothetical protein